MDSVKTIVNPVRIAIIIGIIIIPCHIGSG
jgi:hypothetical protein